MNISFLKNPFYRNLAFFLFAIACFLYSFVLHYHGLSTPAYWDDNTLIFQNAHILEGKNPLHYWLRGNLETKTWPLAHTFFWMEYRFFGADTFFYRATNLGLHWIVGLLAGLFVQRLGGNRWITSLIIWFHPSNVEAVAWISQISTLLTGLFLLFWMKSIFLKNRLKQEVSFLLLMILSKGYAYLLPLLSFSFYFKKENFTWRKLAIAGLISVFAGYFIFLAAVGVGSATGELRFSTEYLYERGDPKNHLNLSQMERENRALLKTAPVQSSDASISVGSAYVRNFFFSPSSKVNPQEFWYRKIHLVGETASFYVKQFFLPLQNAASYPSGAMNVFYFYLGLTVIFSLFAFWYFESKIGLILLLTFIPVSGLVYVPYMKFSLVADRYSYIPYLVLAWFVGLKAGNIKWLKELSFAWILFLILRHHRYVEQFYNNQIPLF